MKKSGIVFLGMLWILASVIHAGEVSPSDNAGSMSLPEILTLVQRDNPDILAAQKAWEIATLQIQSSGTPENPRIDFEWMYAPSTKFSFWNDADEKNIVVNQALKRPDYYSLQKDIAAVMAQVARERHQKKINEILAQTRSAYALYYHAHHVLDLYRENVELLRRFSKVVEAKYIAGQATQSDPLKAQLEITRMRTMELVMAQEKETAQALLNSLLNRPTQAELGKPLRPTQFSPLQSLEQLQNLALAQGPDIHEATLEVSHAALLVNSARLDFWPELMLQYRKRGSAMNGNSHDLMLGVSLPLWQSSLKAREQAALTEQAMHTAQLKALQNMTAYEVKNQLVKVQSAQRFIELYESSVLPQARQILQITEAAYLSGRSGFLDLMDAQRLQLGAQLEYHEYLKQHEQAVAALESLVGTSVYAAASQNPKNKEE